MPVYNAEKYLFECLASILKQSLVDWELIAINDYSTDKSYEILLSFQAQDQRIKVFQNNGKKGIIPSLQLAHKYAKGNLFSRMDADDLMHPNKLKLMKKALIENPNKQIAVPLVKYFSDQTLGEGYQKYAKWLNALTSSETNFKDIYKECIIPSPAWMIVRSSFEKAGGFNNNLYPEDYDLCFRWYKNNYKIIGIHQVLHYWRDYSNRSSRIDPNYADQNFNTLKLHYLQILDLDKKRTLVLWGAGKKAKKLALLLIERKISFEWLTNNTNKIGHNIYNVILKHSSRLEELNKPQIIMAVSAPKDKKEIKDYLVNKELLNNKDYFLFY
jgi:glycosyltransferase involved in cell wall biosynthesis